MTEPKKALITGGTGFVGSHLVESLISDGWEVHVLVRGSSSLENLPVSGWEKVDWNAFLEGKSGLDLSKIDVVYYLAGLTKTIDKYQFREVNYKLVDGFLKVLEKGRFKGHFILLSSLAAVGPCPADHLRHENDQEIPVSYYGKSKLMGEQVVLSYLKKFPVTIMRPGAIYGPKEKDILELIKTLRFGISAAIGPDIEVQLTHVADIVSGIRAVTENTECFGKKYFLNDSDIWSYKESMKVISKVLGKPHRLHIQLPITLGSALVNFIHLISKLKGKPVSPLTRDKFREVTAGSWIADSSLLTQDTGWKRQYDLESGMKHTIDWYREEGWL